MQQHLIGSHRFLKRTSYWLTFLLLDFFCVEIIPLGRDFFEGLYYNVSLSSQIGDRALIMYILIASNVLKKRQIRSSRNQRKDFHIISAIFSAGVGFTLVAQGMLQSGKIGEFMDTYHGLVVIPFLLYFILTTTPIIFVYGTRAQKIAAFFLLLAWLAAFAIDLFTGRLNQREWLQQHGVQFRR